MSSAINSWAALLLTVVGSVAVLIMLDLKGRPVDRKHTKTLINAHKLLGVAFITILTAMFYVMVVKVANYQEEITARAVVHITLALTLIPLITIKLLIVRYFKLMTNYLSVLGSLILILTCVLAALTGGYYFLHRSDIRYTSISKIDTGILDEETGRFFLFKKCIKCHTLERVFRALKTQQEWSETVNRMAVVDTPNIKPFEVKQVIHFLVKQQKRRTDRAPKTAGIDIGRALLVKKCTICHNLDRVFQTEKTKVKWQATIERMIKNSGDPTFLTKSQKRQIIGFLSPDKT